MTHAMAAPQQPPRSALTADLGVGRLPAAHLDWHRPRLRRGHGAVAEAAIDHCGPCGQRHLRGTRLSMSEQVSYVTVDRGGGGVHEWLLVALGAGNVGNVKSEESSIRLLPIALMAEQL